MISIENLHLVSVRLFEIFFLKLRVNTNVGH